MKNTFNRKSIGKILLVVLAIAAFFYVKYNFTFNFVALFVALLGFMTLPLWLTERPKRFIIDPQTREKTVDYVRNSNGAPIYNGGISYKYALGILVFGCLALYALGNYFNAHNNVYYNYDHHALRIDGVKVEDGREFVLAGTHRDALLDVPTINGEVVIKGYDSTGVHLSLNGLTTPIYMKEYDSDEPVGYRCDHGLVASFMDSDRVEIITRNVDSAGQSSISFQITAKHEDAVLGGLVKHANDVIKCLFTEGQHTDTSSFTTFLKNGYPLEGMAVDVPLKTDLSGINIVRNDVALKCKRRDVFDTYSDRPYFIELENGHSVETIRVYRDEKKVHEKNVSEFESEKFDLIIQYDEPFYIGSGSNKSESVYFALDEDGTLQVRYELPKYQRLTSSDGRLESTVMVTSTLVNPNAHSDGDSGLIENLTDNVLLFDVFNNHDNAFHIVPFYVSYMGGPTNERMQFVVMTPDGGVNPYKAYLGKDPQYFAGVKSKNDTEWLVQVEDFKSTSPFRSTNMAWVLFACIVLCAASMIYSGKSYFYTGVEYAAYLLLIAFLCIRFFLMWRVTVFPPLTSISWYEFGHFRDVRWITVVFMGLCILFSIINLAKALLIYLRRRNMKVQDWLYVNRGWIIALCLVAVSVGIGLVTNKWMIAGLLLVLLIVSEIIIFKKHPRLPSKVISMICIPGGMFGLITVVAAIVFAIAKASSTPVVTVLFPVFIYLLIDALIYGLFAKTYLQDFTRDRDLDAVGERATAFALSIWNMLCISGVTLLSDGGYGVMFTMFVLFSLWFKIADLYQYTRYDRENKTVTNIAFMALFVILTLIVVFYKRLFLLVINSFAAGKAWLTIILACLVLLLMAVCVLLVLDQDFKSIMRFVRKRYVAISVVSVITAGLLTVGAIVGQDKIEGSHMQFRSRVHLENAGYILSTTEEPEYQNKFMQASLNDWILYEYERIGQDVKPFGEKGNGYFKIQPQSKLGAMWFAQTTDICVSRYIIAEHGKTLAWLFVAAFAMFLFIALREVSGYRWGRIVFVQVALLFAVQALMILLANTRAFIFFGQDFPLISITSRLSSLYFFMLMMLCVVSAIIGREKYQRDFYDNLQLDSRLLAKNLALRNNIMLFFIISSLSLYFIGKSDRNLGNGGPVKDKAEQTEHKSKAKKHLSEKELRKQMKESAKKSRKRTWQKVGGRDTADTTMQWLNEVAFYKDGVYDVDTLLKVMNAELESIVNPAFEKYQKNVSGVPRLQRNMSAYVAEVMSDKVYMDTALARCSDYTRWMLDRYSETDSKNNSTLSLICLRNVRSFEFQRKKGTSTYKVIPKDVLEFCTSLDHFKYEMPKRETDRWDGHVVEVIRDNFSDTACMAAGNEWSAAYIPGKFTADGKPVQIVKPVGKRGFDLVGVNALLSVRPDGTGKANAVNVSQHDFLIAKERIIDGLPLDRYNYIARNILLNGKRTFIYPNGKKMFWAREFAANKMRKLKSGDPDVELTISKELSNSLYDVYASEVGGGSGRHDDRTVICADGDGRITARVDYRSDPAFRLNPNDYKEIAKISEFLSLNREKGRTTESRFFGAFSHNSLRRGPGSTQKPIVWTAVTSKYNTGWWDDLKMAPIPVKFKGSPVDNIYYHFKEYAGHRLESPFKSLMSDEGDGGTVDLRRYMYKSSNYYNSLMVYLGTYRADSIAKAADVFRDSKGYMAAVEGLKVQEPSRKSYRTQEQYDKAKRKYDYAFAKNSDIVISSFPTMKIDGKYKTFDRFLTQSMVMDTMALLPKGLSENFGLRLIDYEPMSKRPSQYFNMSIRAGRKSDAQLNEYAVRSVAIGNNSAWIVSPNKMAEMYGRLVGLNKKYTLYMEAEGKKGKLSKTEYEMFNLDKSWKGTLSSASGNYTDARKNLLVGMSYVYRYISDRNPLNGTASNIFKLKATSPGYFIGNKDGKDVYLALDDGDENQRSDYLKFYIYGKTGTIDGYWGDHRSEDHMFATIITDRPLSSCKTEEELEAVKFYVIYQVDYSYKELKEFKKGYRGWTDVDKKIIETVINSKAFKDYMGLK